MLFPTRFGGQGLSSTGTPTPSLVIKITSAQNGWYYVSSRIHRGNCITLSANFLAGLDGWNVLLLDDLGANLEVLFHYGY